MPEMVGAVKPVTGPIQVKKQSARPLCVRRALGSPLRCFYFGARAVQLTERGTFPLSTRRRPDMKLNSSWKPRFLAFVSAATLLSFANDPVRAQDKQDK